MVVVKSLRITLKLFYMEIYAVEHKYPTAQIR